MPEQVSDLRSWRDVPMPEGVAALPRSSGGLPVPYVAIWEGEDLMRIARCDFTYGSPAIFPLNGFQVGRTRPVFGVMEPSRQREVAITVRCQVCHVQLPWISDELDDEGEVHWLADLLHEPATMRGHRLALEPWVCDDCLYYALQICPGLVAGKKPLRHVLAVWTANVIGAVVAPGGNLKGRPPCVGYVKIEPLRFVRIAVGHVLEYGPATLRAMLHEEGCTV
jgi:hypothetical protein